MVDRSVSVPVTLGDFERRDAKSQIFPEDFHNYAGIPFDLERPNLEWKQMRWRGVFLMSQP